jgi:hypothetical protein
MSQCSRTFKSGRSTKNIILKKKFSFQCLDLQEFVYGPNDSRTCQTRNSVEVLKKYVFVYDSMNNILLFCRDPMVSRTYFTRPAFRTTKKISHEKEDLQLYQKPPRSSKK